MSEKETQNQELNQTLSEEEIKELIKKALKEGTSETKYLLEISEWMRPGPSFWDRGEIKVLHGEIEKILINEEYDYPTTNKKEYIIIPRTRSVVLLFVSENDYEGRMKEHEKLYIFTYPKGWIKLELY